MTGFGMVCGACRSFNEMGEERCTQCGAALILGLDPEQAARVLEEQRAADAAAAELLAPEPPPETPPPPQDAPPPGPTPPPVRYDDSPFRLETPRLPAPVLDAPRLATPPQQPEAGPPAPAAGPPEPELRPEPEVPPPAAASPPGPESQARADTPATRAECAPAERGTLPPVVQAAPPGPCPAAAPEGPLPAELQEERAPTLGARRRRTPLPLSGEPSPPPGDETGPVSPALAPTSLEAVSDDWPEPVPLNASRLPPRTDQTPSPEPSPAAADGSPAPESPGAPLVPPSHPVPGSGMLRPAVSAAPPTGPAAGQLSAQPGPRELSASGSLPVADGAPSPRDRQRAGVPAPLRPTRPPTSPFSREHLLPEGFAGAGRPPLDRAEADDDDEASGSGAVCPVCQAPLSAGIQFCGNCGARIALQPEGAQRARAGGRAATPQPNRGRARLVLIHGEGQDGTTFPLRGTEHGVGRSTGAILFPEDEFLSPHHATFFYRNNRLYARDEGSLNGLYLRVRGPTELEHGALFLVGEELLRFERLESLVPLPEPDGTYFYSSPLPRGSFRLVQLLEGGREGLVYCARSNTVVIGRENADINFPFDRFLSRHHTRVERTAASTFLLADMGSKNGTYIRLRNEHELQHNDFVFVGKNLLRVDLLSGARG